MSKSLVIAKKDIGSYFHSWLGVIVLVLFVFMMGALFSLLLLSYGKLSLEAAKTAYEGLERIKFTHFVFGSFFVNMGFALIFIVPIISMKAFSEERKHQTIEFLFTYPLSDFEIVWGKFLGVFGFFLILILPSLTYVFLVRWLGAPLDWGVLWVGFAGFLLLSAAYLSLGLFISTLTDSQVVTAMVTFSSLIILVGWDWMAVAFDGKLAEFLGLLSPLAHYRDFTYGIFDFSHVVYFVFFCLYFLFLSLRSVETRNWKG
ncbi:MAG: ABC transporter permease subunit [Candidatus Omnitrophica bacterium]|nr:ABC transporter permease subunit [Candidatus Omnitrophota bacterium]